MRQQKKTQHTDNNLCTVHSRHSLLTVSDFVHSNVNLYLSLYKLAVYEKHVKFYEAHDGLTLCTFMCVCICDSQHFGRWDKHLHTNNSDVLHHACYFPWTYQAVSLGGVSWFFPSSCSRFSAPAVVIPCRFIKPNKQISTFSYNTR